MLKIKESTNKLFEDIKHIDKNGYEYWEARELQKVLEYAQWRRFEDTINRAKEACKNSENQVLQHFADIGKTIAVPNGGQRIIGNYKLSRYACYLIVQNGDSRKEVIALGQTYFAIQTRKQELTEEEYKNLSETEKRLYIRKKVRNKNLNLYQAAKNAEVKNYDNFTNYGYKGLYNGETANDIFKRKGLRYREDILDNMGSDELAANEFRISLTQQKLVNEKIKGQNNANNAHYEVGKAIRETIIKVGATVPEKLPTPDKSIKQIKKETKQIEGNK